jgi:peptidoglycan-associated lipoprotein
MNTRRASLALAAGTALLFSAACHKSAVTPSVPAGANVPPAAPSIEYFTAEPQILGKGQSSSLRWSVKDATAVQIDNNVGSVEPNGKHDIAPQQTTTYTLRASNAAGSVEKTVTVSVSSPPPPAPAAENPAEKAGILASELQDLHFDYNAGDVRPADRALLQEDASVLKNLFSVDPAVVVVIEGHCDERGSAEYNMALGDRRASVVKGALVNLGVAGDKLTTISYGKERPLCVDSTEVCHARNRRAHFSVAQ